MSHLMLDNDPGAIAIPGPLLLLSSFISKGIQHALLNKKWLSRTLLRFAECFDQCCIPSLIYPISPSKSKNFPPHSRTVLPLMLKKLWRSLQICSYAKFIMLFSYLFFTGKSVTKIPRIFGPHPSKSLVIRLQLIHSLSCIARSQPWGITYKNYLSFTVAQQVWATSDPGLLYIYNTIQ